MQLQCALINFARCGIRTPVAASETQHDTHVTALHHSDGK